METPDFVDTLRREGEALVSAAGRAGWDAEVPTCPEWRVRDLVVHVGNVHRWATGYVTERLTERTPLGTDVPPDDELDGWFRAGHGSLLDALRAAPDDLECWTFLPGAGAPRAFWARRQAHETAVHRLDAESALGDGGGDGDRGRRDRWALEAEFARDGVDELLTGFHARARSRVRTEQPRTLLVEAEGKGLSASAPRAWLLRLSAEPARVERLADGAGTAAECTVRGSATALYRALWNRGPYEPLTVTGDASLVALWRRTAAV